MYILCIHMCSWFIFLFFFWPQKISSTSIFQASDQKLIPVLASFSPQPQLAKVRLKTTLSTHNINRNSHHSPPSLQMQVFALDYWIYDHTLACGWHIWWVLWYYFQIPLVQCNSSLILWQEELLMLLEENELKYTIVGYWIGIHLEAFW